MKTEFDVNLLIQRIEMLCSQAGITKTKLFADCDMSRNTINNLKKGSIPSVDKIAVIADYFNVSTDYLIGRTEEPAPERLILVNEKLENTSVSQHKPDGTTEEFFQAFQSMELPDRVEVMKFAFDKMRKGA